MAKITFKKWVGEAPIRPGTKERQPNPFDDIVKTAYETQQSYSFQVESEKDEEFTETLTKHIKLLRSAARYAGHGVDVRIIEGTGTVWFNVRDPRPKKAPLPNETKAAA